LMTLARFACLACFAGAAAQTCQSSSTSSGTLALSESPRIYYMEDFVDADQVEALVAASAGRHRSRVRGEIFSSNAEARRSKSHVFSWSDEKHIPVVGGLKRAIATRLMTPIHHFEGLQTQEYSSEDGGYYRAHLDNPEDASNPRSVTVLIYLTDVPRGGETVFPHVVAGSRWSPQPSGEWRKAGLEIFDRSCGGDKTFTPQPLSVKPRSGSAVVFFSTDEYGRADRRSMHGSCPTLQGAKLVMQQWIHQHTYQPGYRPDLRSSFSNLTSVDRSEVGAVVLPHPSQAGLACLDFPQSFSFTVAWFWQCGQLARIGGMIVNTTECLGTVEWDESLLIATAHRGRPPRHWSGRLGDEIRGRLRRNKLQQLAVTVSGDEARLWVDAQARWEGRWIEASARQVCLPWSSHEIWIFSSALEPGEVGQLWTVAERESELGL